MSNGHDAVHGRSWLRHRHLNALLLFVIAQTLATELRAQSPDNYEPKITGVPPVVQRVAKSLWLRARMYLETGSPSFYAVGVRAQDTSQIMKEFAPTRRVNPRTSKAVAEALGRAARQEFARETQAVGIITDSIATSAADPAADAPRFAVSEINTTHGLCVRIITPYRLIRRDDSPGLSRVSYGAATRGECEWQNYWKDFIDLSARVAAARAPVAPLTAPVVKPLRMVSKVDEESDATLRGEFAGTLTMYDDSVVVVLDEIKIRNTARPTSEPTKLEFLVVGVAGEFNGEWSVLDESEPAKLDQSVRGGQQLTRPRTRFVIHRRRTHHDADYWLVVGIGALGRAPLPPYTVVPMTIYERSEAGVLSVQ